MLELITINNATFDNIIGLSRINQLFLLHWKLDVVKFLVCVNILGNKAISDF